MGAWRNHIELWAVLCVLNAIFASAMIADDVASHYPLRITVLHAETHALSGEAQNPGNCNLVSYSPSCGGTESPRVENILLVRDADGESYRITCTNDSRRSKCTTLPVEKTFQARKEKHGITILYRDEDGKERKQFYKLLAAFPAPKSGAAAESQPHAAAPLPNAPVPASPSGPPTNSQVHAAAPLPNAPAPAPTTRSMQQVTPDRVRCTFSSTPSGAEITLDGRYMGNTPSEIDLLPGTYSVILSLPGFTQWKRELTVLPGSDLQITATLQKQQQ